METYIVRIYRRETDDHRMLAGTVEEPGKPEKKVFTSVKELWNILVRLGHPKHIRRLKPMVSKNAEAADGGRDG